MAMFTKVLLLVATVCVYMTCDVIGKEIGQDAGFQQGRWSGLNTGFFRQGQGYPTFKDKEGRQGDDRNEKNRLGFPWLTPGGRGSKTTGNFAGSNGQSFGSRLYRFRRDYGYPGGFYGGPFGGYGGFGGYGPGSDFGQDFGYGSDNFRRE